MAIQHACPQADRCPPDREAFRLGSPEGRDPQGRGHLDRQGRNGRDRRVLRPGRPPAPATGRATICNMGAEIGATCSLFSYDDRTRRYLQATHRDDIADLADRYATYLRPDPEVEAEPERFFDRV